MKRNKVLYIVPPSVHFAGIERVVHLIATELAETYSGNFDVTVAYCYRYKELEEFSPLKYQARYIMARKLRDLVGSLRVLFQSEPFDLAICPQVEASVMTWIALKLARKNIPLVAHLHGNPIIEESISTKNRYVFWFFRKVVGPSLRGIFAVSESLAKYTEANLAGGTPVFHLPNPVRPLKVAKKLPSAGQSINFVSVGRLAVQKGQDILLRAFAAVLKEEPTARLTLVGGGQLEGELKALAKDLNLGEAIVFRGFISNPTAELQQADVFVLSSRWEGCPLVLLEALSIGLPLVAADCNFGPADLIKDRSIGRLVPVGDVAALSKAMLDVARTPYTQEDVESRKDLAASYTPAQVSIVHADAVLAMLENRQPIAAPSRFQESVLD